MVIAIKFEKPEKNILRWFIEFLQLYPRNNYVGRGSSWTFSLTMLWFNIVLHVLAQKYKFNEDNVEEAFKAIERGILNRLLLRHVAKY